MYEVKRVKSFPRYFSNNNLQKDVTILTVNQLEKLYNFKFHTNLKSRSNSLIKQLFFASFPGKVRRKLKRHWSGDLLK